MLTKRYEEELELRGLVVGEIVFDSIDASIATHPGLVCIHLASGFQKIL